MADMIITGYAVAQIGNNKSVTIPGNITEQVGSGVTLTSAKIKMWDGSQWIDVSELLNIYNGASFVDQNLSAYNGSLWKDARPDIVSTSTTIAGYLDTQAGV